MRRLHECQKEIIQAKYVLFHSPSPSSSEPDPPPNESRSVGDVVQGLHGSKYQFADSGSTSLEGQQFAKSLYTSGNYQGDKSSIDSTLENEPLPKWAIQWQEQFIPPASAPDLQVVMYAKDDNSATPLPSATISIQNDERTWEKFYTFVLLLSGREQKIDASYLIQVTPRMGMLAPRGTASNNKDFSDTVELYIQGKVAVDLDASESLWLLVGTEAEQWVYQLT